MKKGSPAHDLAWKAIVEKLHGISKISTQGQKNSKRELLRKKFTKKMSKEEKESGISVEE